MKLLLINLPGDSVRKPEEHCGLGFLKAYMENKGIQTDIIDAYACRMNMDESERQIQEWIYQNQKNHQLYIGISPFVTGHDNFLRAGMYIKKLSPECIVFAGGHYASLNKEYFMSNFEWLDAVIVGEGEKSLFEMLSRPFSENIPGVYKRNYSNQFILRERIKNLDELPFQSRYLSPEKLEGQPFAITTSRGCYGECSFCSISSFYKLNGKIKQTFRSAKSVSKEIHWLVKQYNISSLKIVDDNFFRNESDDFLNELTEYLSDVNISFRLSARPNDITEYRAKKLKEMGAVVVGIGAESAHPASLKLFNKGIDISYSDRAIRYLNNNGITCLVNFIMFNPIIDINGLKQNCEFVQRHSDESLFHRINSHLWIRATDPMVKELKDLKLCDGEGFPYIKCRYVSEDIIQIRKYFDIWCEHNMKEYYQYADILMANGIYGNEYAYQKYKIMLKNDIEIFKNLIQLCENKVLDQDGNYYIQKCMEAFG